jgi:hypothetical protein
VPFSQFYTGIHLTTDGKHGKPQSGQPDSVTLFVASNLAAVLGSASTGLQSISPPRLPVDDFILQVAEIRGSPHRITSIHRSLSVL